ncbi:hypothetical protein N7373_05195 [Achromobacter mucicolens]|uniref:hypothetical protein n=1 Tax=Achromobacter mucicolens TaxID=1389922 RepID=UPI0024476E9B|nr:hypothetical protein [Achromobacter mucicolens]MDH0090835.1 hypothetical protein [Achromobacter mucicolens]
MKTSFFALLLHLILALMPAGAVLAQPADSLMPVSPALLNRVDQEAEATLLRLYRQSPAAKALAGRSFGVLVVPALHADGSMLGLAYGRGVLIDAAEGRDYYNVIASPPGSVLGWNGKALILVFSSYAALRGFQIRPGWEEGASGSIQILDEAAMAARELVVEPIAGFILSEAGLVRGLSVKGMVFIKVPVYLCADGGDACRGKTGIP